MRRRCDEITVQLPCTRNSIEMTLRLTVRVVVGAIEQTWTSRDTPREETARCGNCPHDPDAHSPVGLELCSFRGCECQGLLTVAPREGT